MDEQDPDPDYVAAKALAERFVQKTHRPDGRDVLRIDGSGYSQNELKCIVFQVYDKWYEISSVTEHCYGAYESVTMVELVESQENDAPTRTGE